MRILLLCHRMPLPVDGGGKIRPLNMIRHFVSSGHEVTVCSLVRTDAEQQGAQELERTGAAVVSARVGRLGQLLRMLACLPTTRPFSFGYFHSSRLARRIDALLREQRWDLILVHCSSMAPYVLGAARAPMIMDFCDMDSQKWLDYSRQKPWPAAFVYALEGWKLERAERRLAGAFDFCTTISGNELDTLREINANAPAGWFPNGVDAAYFAPLDGYDPNCVVFVGRMDYYPNEQAMLWFSREVWPRLRSIRPQANLKIVGANPPASIRRLNGNAGVRVTGFVADVRSHVGRAAVSVAPLLIARGLQNKVLECMALGVPVITTQRVARGLGLDGNSPLQIADTADEYVEALGRLLGDEALRDRLSHESRAVVTSRFGWETVLGRLDSFIESCAARRVAVQRGEESVASPS